MITTYHGIAWMWLSAKYFEKTSNRCLELKKHQLTVTKKDAFGWQWEWTETGNRREGESCAEHHSCGEQADSAQQSKHTAGFPERRRALEIHQPPGPHHQSCWQMHPSNLLLSTTFNRKTASHYPGQGVCWFPGVTPSASGRYPQGLYSQVCLPLELPLLWTAG